MKSRLLFILASALLLLLFTSLVVLYFIQCIRERKPKKIILLDTENIGKTPDFTIKQLNDLEKKIDSEIKKNKDMISSDDEDLAKSEKVALHRIAFNELSKKV